MAEYFDRYIDFRKNNKIEPVPGIIIPEGSNDLFDIYKKNITRLDKVSNIYYNNPYSGWLILLANPQFGGLEFNIPNNTKYRIPFPFEDALNRYLNEITNFKKLYG